VRDGREEELVEVPEDRREGLSLLRSGIGERREQVSRRRLREHGKVSDLLQVPGDPVDGGVAVLAEAHDRSFSMSAHGRAFRI
jgi:hypothetical protein